MSSLDFTNWATPNLDFTLAGHDYSARPPSVDQARIILAFAAVAENQLRKEPEPSDPVLVAITLAQKVPLAVITLGQDVYDQMISDGIDQATTDRVGYYGIHFWARGKERADALAESMWSPKPEVPAAAPKAPQDRRSKSGRSTASASRTKTASTRTTGSPKA